MKFTVANVTAELMEIDVPDFCPHCRADMKSPDALLHWEYQDQKRRATAMDDGVDWSADDVPTGGDDFIPISWECAACGYKFGEGSFEVKK